jgi:hypothetical protein
MDSSFHIRPREQHSGANAIPYTKKLSNETCSGSATPGTTAKLIGGAARSTATSKRSMTW